ncbi:MAG: Nif3-like dinuclear metal center hexameric protein [Desulfamplus sp.]|nr:Nif3-like dinuclear metal center hexameric protein [Desulfamplus sp.]
MHTTVKDIILMLNEIAPPSLAEEWDNCGLQAGDLSWPVNKILVSLDVSMAVMNHAANSHADLVISHHPLMLRAPKSIDFAIMPGSAIAVSAQRRISIASVHTSLDKVEGGLNDFFASILGLKNIKPLVLSDHCIGTGKFGMNGIGRTGKLERIVSLQEMALYVKKKFELSTIRMAGKPDLMVNRVALCTGSGGSLLRDFLRSGTDVYITGDIKYHEAREIEQAGLGLIDLGHFASEQIAVELLSEKLKNAAVEKGMSLEIEGFDKDFDPFITIYNIVEEC